MTSPTYLPTYKVLHGTGICLPLRLSPVLLSSYCSTSTTLLLCYIPYTGTLFVPVTGLSFCLLHCFVILFTSWLTCHILWKVYLKVPKTQFSSPSPPSFSSSSYLPFFCLALTTTPSYIIYFLSLLLLKVPWRQDSLFYVIIWHFYCLADSIWTNHWGKN